MSVKGLGNLRNLPNIDLSKFVYGTVRYRQLQIIDANGKPVRELLARPSRDLRRFLKAQREIEREEDRVNAVPLDIKFPIEDKQAHAALVAKIIAQSANVCTANTIWPAEPPLGKGTPRLKYLGDTPFHKSNENYERQYDAIRDTWAKELNITKVPYSKTEQVERAFYKLSKTDEDVDKDSEFFVDSRDSTGSTMISRQGLVDRAIDEYKGFYSLVDNRNKNLLYEQPKHELDKNEKYKARVLQKSTPAHQLLARAKDFKNYSDAVHELKKEASTWIPNDNEDALKAKIADVFSKNVVYNKSVSKYT